jgi:peptidoglycan/LPS O-acetylase OafA/YrhL
MDLSSKRIPELDGVRGIAILMVLLFHLSPAIDNSQHWLVNSAISAARFGGTGVDLFFVLSGFLICGILVDNRSAENYFKVFYVRRIFRIVPLYFLIALTFFTLSFAWHHQIINAPAWLMDVSIPRWSYLTFTQNFWMARLKSLGSAVLAPTWSLAVEEQFYLVFPLMVGLVPPRLLTKILLATMTGAILLRLVVRIAHLSNDIALLVLTPCRADILSLGALIALAMRVEKVRAFLTMHHTKLYVIFGLLIPHIALAVVAYSPERANQMADRPTTGNVDTSMEG